MIKTTTVNYIFRFLDKTGITESVVTVKCNKIHFTLSQKKGARLYFVFQLKHWLAIWWQILRSPSSILTSGVWRSCLAFLCTTSGWKDKESNRLQPLSAASIISLCIYYPRPLLSTVASSTLISELCLLMFWNLFNTFSSQGTGTLWVKCIVSYPWTSLPFYRNYN